MPSVWANGGYGASGGVAVSEVMALDCLLQAYGEMLKRARAAEALEARVQAYVDLYGETASGFPRPSFEMLRTALSEYSVAIYGGDVE